MKKRRSLTAGEGQALATRLDPVGMIPSLVGVHTSALITPVGQDRLILTFRAQASPNYSRGLDAFRYSPARQGGIHTETAL